MRVPFQNLMEKTKRKSFMQVSQSNSRNCSSSQIETGKVIMTYSWLCEFLLNSVRPHHMHRPQPLTTFTFKTLYH